MLTDLLEALNTTGTTFVMDAWTNAPQGDYGVVDIASDTIMWADNKPLKRTMTVNVWLYTTDDGADQADEVREVLAAAAHMITFRQVGRNFITNPTMVQWHWEIVLRGQA